MGIGHKNIKQINFFSSNWKHQLSHGGELRKKQLGRGQRPLSTKDPIHVVFKVRRFRLHCKSLRAPKNFRNVNKLIEKYAKHFYIKVEQVSVQSDHIHLLIRTTRRRNFQSFFRVFSGQIAQSFALQGLLSTMTDTLGNDNRLWKSRPFSRVVRGWKSYSIVRDYIQLNEMEATGKIKYRKSRLRGMSTSDWQILWT